MTAGFGEELPYTSQGGPPCGPLEHGPGPWQPAAARCVANGSGLRGAADAAHRGA
jgi:hypothetical protein